MDLKGKLFNQLKPVIPSLIGALIIATVGFLFHSILFKNPNINGQWIVTTKMEKSDYKPYVNTSCISTFQITQSDDNMITGTGEKLMDISAKGIKTSYATVQRDRVKFTGKLVHNYLEKSTLELSITDIGSKYTTTAHYILYIDNSDELVGEFTTTIGNGIGKIEMKKDKINL